MRILKSYKAAAIDPSNIAGPRASATTNLRGWVAGCCGSRRGRAAPAAAADEDSCNATVCSITPLSFAELYRRPEFAYDVFTTTYDDRSTNNS